MCKGREIFHLTSISITHNLLTPAHRHQPPSTTTTTTTNHKQEQPRTKAIDQEMSPVRMKLQSDSGWAKKRDVHSVKITSWIHDGILDKKKLFSNIYLKFLNQLKDLADFQNVLFMLHILLLHHITFLYWQFHFPSRICLFLSHCSSAGAHIQVFSERLIVDPMQIFFLVLYYTVIGMPLKNELYVGAIW